MIYMNGGGAYFNDATLAPVAFTQQTLEHLSAVQSSTFEIGWEVRGADTNGCSISAMSWHKHAHRKQTLFASG